MQILAGIRNALGKAFIEGKVFFLF